MSRSRAYAFIVGLVGLALTVLGAYLHDHDRFFHSYLFAYVFWLDMSLGAMAVLMMYHLTSGVWGVVLRNLLLAAARTISWLALLFLPLFAGLRTLFPWARPEELAADPKAQYKARYLNIPFFTIRTVFYFLCWIGLAWLLNRWSAERESDGACLERKAKLRALSGGGLVLYAITATFFAIDWLMSAESHFYSTMYSWIFLVSQGLSSYSMILVALAVVARRLGMGSSFSKKGLDDLGNILLAMVMTWAYLSFFQYLVTWMGNLPDEAIWYVHRFNGGWMWVGRGLIFFQFGAPFFLLLFRGIKHRLSRLVAVAAFVLFMRFWDTFWKVMPAFHPGGWSLSWMDLSALLGIGGIWFALFLRYLGSGPVFPESDPLWSGALRSEIER